MKFKDRLDIVNEINNFADTENVKLKEQDCDVLKFFEKNSKAENIIKKLINEDKNIILACSVQNDKSVLPVYIKSFINKNESIEELRNISDNLSYISASKIIIPEPSVKDVIKILELILTGFKSFIFSLNIKSTFNIPESIKTLLSLNCPYISQESLNHLLLSSDCAVIFFSRNDDGLYFVENIGEIIYSDSNKIQYENLYIHSPQDAETVDYDNENKNEDENTQDSSDEEIQANQKEEIEISPVEINDVYNNLEKSEIDENNTEELQDIQEVKNEVKVLKNKVNKYKLLKMKIKSKK